jgi:hypothetical protein
VMSIIRKEEGNTIWMLVHGFPCVVHAMIKYIGSLRGLGRKDT